MPSDWPRPKRRQRKVGRAGRGTSAAEVVLCPTPTDGDVWAYFDSTAMPPRHVVDEVLTVLQRGGPASIADIEAGVNLRRGRLDDDLVERTRIDRLSPGKHAEARAAEDGQDKECQEKNFKRAHMIRKVYHRPMPRKWTSTALAKIPRLR